MAENIFALRLMQNHRLHPAAGEESLHLAAGLAKPDPPQHRERGGIVGRDDGFQPIEIEMCKRPLREPRRRF